MFFRHKNSIFLSSDFSFLISISNSQHNEVLVRNFQFAYLKHSRQNIFNFFLRTSRFFSIFVLISLLKAFTATAQNVVCEKIEINHWPHAGSTKTCTLKEVTIDQLDARINSSIDEAMVGLDFHSNKKVFYLPIDVHEIFPGLQVYSASHCSIKKITRRNFMQLKKMKVIWLTGNQIERISSDAFDDLTAMVELQMSEKVKVQ